MNMRPRCRPWLPLFTQQMRLRNLIRIQGVNIECRNKQAFIYYTLHHTQDEAAFYTSELLPYMNLQQKWAEIECPEILKSNANCVCVKVWSSSDTQHYVTAWVKEQKSTSMSTEISTSQRTQHVGNLDSSSALSKQLSRTCLSPNSLTRPPDKLLFTWGVYFSGLMLLSQENDFKCRANALIFLINSDYFASPEHFSRESLQEQLSLNYQRYSSSLPQKNTIVYNKISIKSPQVSRSSSPEPTDWQQDLLGMSKLRFLQLNCTRGEVRKSYDLQKLLRLQELQRVHLNKLRESVECAKDLGQISVRCINKEQLQKKRRTTSTSLHQQHHQYHSMGRKLSVLLAEAEQQQMDPRTLLCAQQLQKQIETLRCRRQLLQDERNTYSMRLEQQRQHLDALKHSREQLESWLLTKRNHLLTEQQILEGHCQKHTVLLDTKRHVLQQVEHRMAMLCMELREIYPIDRNQQSFHTICDLPFPLVEIYAPDTKHLNASVTSTEYISPLALSASLGYLAHLVQMMAIILNRPLRNQIIHEGSRSRIVDNIKDIPYTSREFPLYTRSTIFSNAAKYGIYLLNQNIAQLCYEITGTRCDKRNTIENLLHIFTKLLEIKRSQSDMQPLETLYTNSTNQHRLQDHRDNKSISKHKPLDSTGNINTTQELNSVECLSKSHSSVDMMHVPVPLMLTTNHALGTTTAVKITTLFQPLALTERTTMQQRICRSVGSYSDCEDEDFTDGNMIGEHCYSNSDSNLTFGQNGRQHI